MKYHKIVHISDLHCSEDTDLKLMEEAGRLINKQNPNLIICTGDFIHPDEFSINDTQGITSRERRHRMAKEFINSLTCKDFYSIPGNHDCYDNSKYRNITLSLYKKYWKEDSFSANLEGLFLIGVNSTIINETIQKVSGSPGNVSDDSISFIEEKIQMADKNDFRVFCLHHHLIPIFNDTYDNARNLDMVWNAGKVLRVLRRNRFDLVLQGHKHDPEIFVLDDTVFLIGGSLLLKLPNNVENSFYSIDVDDLITVKIHFLQSETQKVIHCTPNKRYIPTM